MVFAAGLVAVEVRSRRPAGGGDRHAARRTESGLASRATMGRARSLSDTTRRPPLARGRGRRRYPVRRLLSDPPSLRKGGRAG